MFLLTHELIHLTSGLMLGIIFYLTYKQKSVVVFSVLLSLVIDIDHMFDLLIYSSQNKQPFNLFLLFSDYFHKSGKVYVFLHSYEIVLLFIFIAFLLPKFKQYFFLISISMFTHIIIDQLTYNPVFLEYFFSYRLINSFSIEAFK